MAAVEKKTYEKPELNSIELDREIALVMMTSDTDPGGGDPRLTAPANASSTTTSNFKKNPFKETK